MNGGRQKSGINKGGALVTGGAKRIGKAIALHLAVMGYGVGLHYNTSVAEAKETADEIIAAGGKAVLIAGDLADAGRCAALVGEAVAELGSLSVLINNASLFEADTVRDFSLQSWDDHFNINLRAPAILSQSFANQVAVGTPGNIINLIDQRVWSLTPYFSSYTLSKAGLWTLTQTSAMALAPNIRVNAIGPGPTVPSPRQSPEHFAAQAASTPLGHGTSPEEIADAVSYILQASAMTGQMIALDGGQHLPWRANNTTDLE
jgi:NAD(P)-dependent dehydrogenase (short-subunit alcohol dehydrogenase family)